MKYDDVLVGIGEFGKYQKRVFLLTSIIAVVSGYQFMSVVFAMFIPKHRCAIPFYENDTYEVQSSYHADLINLTIPMVTKNQEQTYSQCSIYNVTDPASVNSTSLECSSWVFDTSVMASTVISEFNMVCSNEIYRSFGTMMSFLGATLGTVAFGMLSDGFGRKKAMMTSIILNLVANFAGAFAPSFFSFVAIQFFYGFTGPGFYMIPLVIGLEMVGPSKRTLVGMVLNLFWVTGLFVLALAAYLTRHWRHLRIALAVPSILCLSYWWLMPESPRWLLAKGRYEEAKKIIKAIAKTNQVEISESLLKNVTTEKGKSLGVIHLFSSPRLIVRALIVFSNMFAVGLMYICISLILVDLSGNAFLNLVYSALSEILAYTITMVLMFRVGRKPLLVTVMMIGGVSSICAIFPVLYGNSSTGWILLTIAMLGKFSSSGGFALSMIYAGELFPTSLRESAIALADSFCSVGSLVAPYIADLSILVEGDLADALPFIVFGVLTMVVGLLACALPETRNKRLPETLEDMLGTSRNNDASLHTLVPATEEAREMYPGRS